MGGRVLGAAGGWISGGGVGLSPPSLLLGATALLRVLGCATAGGEAMAGDEVTCADSSGCAPGASAAGRDAWRDGLKSTLVIGGPNVVKDWINCCAIFSNSASNVIQSVILAETATNTYHFGLVLLPQQALGMHLWPFPLTLWI